MSVVSVVTPRMFLRDAIPDRVVSAMPLERWLVKHYSDNYRGVILDGHGQPLASYVRIAKINMVNDVIDPRIPTNSIMSLCVEDAVEVLERFAPTPIVIAPKERFLG